MVMPGFFFLHPLPRVSRRPSVQTGEEINWVQGGQRRTAATLHDDIQIVSGPSTGGERQGEDLDGPKQPDIVGLQ
jgi:hypothetical protein